MSAPPPVPSVSLTADDERKAVAAFLVQRARQHEGPVRRELMHAAVDIEEGEHTGGKPAARLYLGQCGDVQPGGSSVCLLGEGHYGPHTSCRGRRWASGALERAAYWTASEADVPNEAIETFDAEAVARWLTSDGAGTAVLFVEQDRRAYAVGTVEALLRVLGESFAPRPARPLRYDLAVRSRTLRVLGYTIESRHLHGMDLERAWATAPDAVRPDLRREVEIRQMRVRAALAPTESEREVQAFERSLRSRRPSPHCAIPLVPDSLRAWLHEDLGPDEVRGVFGPITWATAPNPKARHPEAAWAYRARGTPDDVGSVFGVAGSVHDARVAIHTWAAERLALVLEVWPRPEGLSGAREALEACRQFVADAPPEATGGPALLDLIDRVIAGRGLPPPSSEPAPRSTPERRDRRPYQFKGTGPAHGYLGARTWNVWEAPPVWCFSVRQDGCTTGGDAVDREQALREVARLLDLAVDAALEGE